MPRFLQKDLTANILAMMTARSSPKREHIAILPLSLLQKCDMYGTLPRLDLADSFP